MTMTVSEALDHAWWLKKVMNSRAGVNAAVVTLAEEVKRLTADAACDKCGSIYRSDVQCPWCERDYYKAIVDTLPLNGDGDRNPADVAAHERVKVLEAEARAQQVVLDAFNASVKILKHENEKLREVLAGMQWVYPFNTASPRCRGCGTAKGNEHAHNCEIYNALNPKTEWEAAKVVCEECEPKISCENCARFKPLCCNINFREDCGDFMPKESSK